MELSNKILEQIAFNTRPKIEEHMLLVMDNSTHEEHLSQPLQTNIKQIKIAGTFLTDYIGIFNGTNKNNKFNFTVSINDDDFSQISIPPGANGDKSLDKEIERNIIEDGYITKENYPFIVKPNFSTLGSIIESKPDFIGTQISFVYKDSIRDLLGFDSIAMYEKYNLSQNPVDFLSFDNIFLETDIVQGMIFKGKRSGIIHNFTMDVNPGFKYI